MAETKNTIKYNGKEVDKEEFVDLAKLSAIDWMDYQELQGSDRTAFLNAFNSTMKLIVEGKNSSKTSDEYVGYGNINDDSTHPNTNIEESLSVYLNGIADGLKKSSSKKTTDDNEDETPAFDATKSFALHLGKSVFGEFGSGNKEQASAQLSRWADAYGDKADASGNRSTKGRMLEVKNQLGLFKQDLLNGKYKFESDDAKTKAISDIDTAMGLIGNDGTVTEQGLFTLSKLLGSTITDGYLFTNSGVSENLDGAGAGNGNAGGNSGIGNTDTDEEDEEAPEDEEVAETASLQTSGKKFNGVVSTSEYRLPRASSYGTDSNGKYKFESALENSGWSSAELGKYIQTALNMDLSSWLNYNGLYYDFKGGLTNIVGDGYNARDYKQTLAPNWYVKFANEYDAGPDDWFGDIANKYGYTAKGYEAKFVSDYLYNALMTNKLDTYKFGLNNYILLDTFNNNLDSGAVLVYNPKTSTLNKYTVNSEFLRVLQSNNPALHKMMIERAQAAAKAAEKKEQGGILKAQFGTQLNLDADQETDNSEKKKEEEKLKNESYALVADDEDMVGVSRDRRTHLTTSEKLSIHSAALDLASLIASFFPGYGSAISVGSGIGSTAMQLASDITNDGLSTGQKVWNTASNIGLDIVGAIPYIGEAAGWKKVLRTATKAFGIAIPIVQTYEYGDEYVKSMQNVLSGKFTPEDLSMAVQALNMVTGLAGNAHRKGADYRHNSEGNAVTFRRKAPQGEGTVEQTVVLPRRVAAAVKQAKSQEEIDNIVNTYTAKNKWSGKSDLEEFKVRMGAQEADNALYDPSVLKEMEFTGWKNPNEVGGWAGNTSVRVSHLKREETLGFYGGNPWKNNENLYQGKHIKSVHVPGLGRIKRTLAEDFGPNYGNTRFHSKKTELNTTEVHPKQTPKKEKIWDPSALRTTTLEELRALRSRPVEEPQRTTQSALTDTPAPHTENAPQPTEGQQAAPQPVQTEALPTRPASEEWNEAAAEWEAAEGREPVEAPKKAINPNFKLSDNDTALIVNKYRKSSKIADKNVNTVRSEINRKAEELSKTMSPDEVIQWFKDNDESWLVERLKGQNVRTNNRKGKGKRKGNKSSPYKSKDLAGKLEEGGIIPKYFGGKPMVYNSEGGYSYSGGDGYSATTGTTDNTSTGEGSGTTDNELYTGIYDRTSTQNTYTGKWIDGTQTNLELQKFLGANLFNKLILDKSKRLLPLLKKPLLKEYRIWSPKQYIDIAQGLLNEYNTIGNLSARNTSDQGTAMAYLLSTKQLGDAAAKPYLQKYGEDITTSVDKSIDIANENVKNRHDVVEGNDSAIVGKKNQDTMFDIQYLNHLGTKHSQLLTAMQAGRAQTALQQYNNDANSFVVSDPEIVKARELAEQASREYERIYSTSQDQDAIDKALLKSQQATDYFNSVYQRRIGWWKGTHPQPLTLPFSGPLSSTVTIASTQSPFIFPGGGLTYYHGSTPTAQTTDNGIGRYKSGGKTTKTTTYDKLLEAEKERTRRLLIRQYYDTQKLLLQESNKKQKNLGSGIAYFTKIMMQGK